MSLPAVATAVAASTSLSSVSSRRSSPASRVPAPHLRFLHGRLLSSSSSSSSSLSPLAPVSAAAPSPTAAGEAASRKKLIIFDAEEELAASLAEHTAELSAKFAAERGAFTVVLSGGSLVKALRKLAEPPYLEAVDWSRWHVFWVDERVVPKDHADSNYKLASDEFLSKIIHLFACFVGLITEAPHDVLDIWRLTMMILNKMLIWVDSVSLGLR
ncbi:unnamed protein product [Urochloa decumbens]|uniref:Glucosamine/galactosamine-6-phosphate isomerase domain-containing protein n=1 Tax=Urochloa decumbens TaxID=240449 RepID=A0ABC9BEI3_9POAL